MALSRALAPAPPRMRIHPKLPIRGLRTELQNYLKMPATFSFAVLACFTQVLPCLGVSVHAKPHASARASAAFFRSVFLFLRAAGRSRTRAGRPQGPALSAHPRIISLPRRGGDRGDGPLVCPHAGPHSMKAPGGNGVRCSAPEKDCATRARARGARRLADPRIRTCGAGLSRRVRKCHQNPGAPGA